MIILEIRIDGDCDCANSPLPCYTCEQDLANGRTPAREPRWQKIGNGKSFIDKLDAEVWGERFYPTNVRRIREV